MAVYAERRERGERMLTRHHVELRRRPLLREAAPCTRAPGRVAGDVDKCLFDGNDASGGFGGGLYAHRRSSTSATYGNFAGDGGGASFRSGGVVSSSIFVDNNATQDVGGGVHITSATDIVDGGTRARFRGVCFGIIAARAARVFPHGRQRMLANEFSSNALTGAVNVPAYANLNDYYACTDMCRRCTLRRYDAHDA